MQFRAIDQQHQRVATQQNNINLSSDDFSKLLKSLKNRQKETSQDTNKADVPMSLPATTSPDKTIELHKKSEPVPMKAPVIQQPKTTIEIKTKDIDIAPTASVTTESDKTIELGVIDKDNPTVSQLLKNNPNYRKDTWNIIFSEVNKTKEFKRIREGTTISINTVTNELVWKGAPPRNQAIPIPTNISPESITKDGQIIIGEISKDNPTVSHLLKQNSFYSDYTWKIIFSDVNNDKPYTSLRSGKIVTINPKTYELSFLNKKDVPASKQINATDAHTLNNHAKDHFSQEKDFSKRLADSVKTYIGTPYNEIDCYGLLVKGIKSQGINYSENGGIRDRMEKLALDQGLPLNAYQNGEGLIETSGTKIFGKTYVDINDAERHSGQVFSEIEPILKEGEILSFSTPSRGHTGIVSRKNDTWTYINSGIIDNQVDSGVIGMRVGEERLKEELENWFVLAKSKNESLKISIGLLDEGKLTTGSLLIAQNNNI